VHALQSAGHEPLEIAGQNGTLVALAYGARILGLFAGDRPNLLWAQPSLANAETAVEFFAAPGWRNTGGDRIWISPERDLHVRDLTDAWRSYQFQDSIDPGKYELVRTESEIRFTTRTSVVHHRAERSCGIELSKQFRLAPNPLRSDPGARWLLAGTQYAGYEQLTQLRYAGAESDFRPALSIWEAVNLPAPGQVFIPTVRETRAKDFFEPTGPSHLLHSDNCIRFVFDARERHKIAVRVTDLLGGRAGYYRKLDGEECTLVVRNFAIDPSAEYIDTPWDDPEDRGYVLQCYNDSGLNGAYGELEYHSPAMGNGTGRMECSDRAQLWSFQGPQELILEIMRRLLGSALTNDLIRQKVL
jgi:hypothetical protein